MHFKRFLLWTTLIALFYYDFCKRFPNCLASSLEPLILTPLIERGQLTKARQECRVGKIRGDGGIESCSGFFTVNAMYDSNLFFWYFPNKNEFAPLLLWLQGGPGGASTGGLFVENGPFQISSDYKLQLREFAWTQPFSVVYIDSPVGAGFSFTRNQQGFARVQEDVTRDLSNALGQFFQLFPEKRKNDFYLTGESYAGKYIPSLAYYLHKQSGSQINLKGLIIGNPWIDPISQINYGPLLEKLSLIDSEQQKQIDCVHTEVVQLIKREQFLEARQKLNQIVDTKNSFYANFTGLHNQYDYRLAEEPKATFYHEKFVEKASVRRAIHVGRVPYNFLNQTVSDNIQDLTKSAKPEFEALLPHYKVMLYNGQNDVIVHPSLTIDFLETVNWPGGKEAFEKSNRDVWKVNPKDEEVAGYIKIFGNFWQVVIRNAGHLAPFYKPRECLDLIKRFIDDKKL